MKRLIIFSVLVFLFSGFIEIPDTSVVVPNNAYQAGESLKYLLYYGWISGGTASLSVQKTDYEGKTIYHAKATAKTLGWADKLYKINDVYESYFDEATGKPVVAIRNISEKEYRFYDEVKFFHGINKVDSKRKGIQDVPKNIFDLVSAFYYSRRILFKNMAVGDTMRFDTYFDDKVYPVQVRFLGKEIIKTKAGEFRALKFVPVVEPGRIFDDPDDMKFWVSDDENFLPLRIQFDLMVGALKCDLVEYSGLKNKLVNLNE